MCFPAFFVLPPNKQQVTYSQMWTEIKSLKPGLAPRSVQIDFELASKAALIEAFPQTHIYGCYFHLGQSLWRKIQENGLQRLYLQDENVRMALKMLLALAFLPVDEVSDAFDSIGGRLPSRSNASRELLRRQLRGAEKQTGRQTTAIVSCTYVECESQTRCRTATNQQPAGELA